jgi:hypothetical protein
MPPSPPSSIELLERCRSHGEAMKITTLLVLKSSYSGVGASSSGGRSGLEALVLANAMGVSQFSYFQHNISHEFIVFLGRTISQLYGALPRFVIPRILLGPTLCRRSAGFVYLILSLIFYLLFFTRYQVACVDSLSYAYPPPADLQVSKCKPLLEMTLAGCSSTCVMSALHVSRLLCSLVFKSIGYKSLREHQLVHVEVQSLAEVR